MSYQVYILINKKVKVKFYVTLFIYKDVHLIRRNFTLCRNNWSVYNKLINNKICIFKYNRFCVTFNYILIRNGIWDLPIINVDCTFCKGTFKYIITPFWQFQILPLPALCFLKSLHMATIPLQGVMIYLNGPLIGFLDGLIGFLKVLKRFSKRSWKVF